MFAVFAGLMSMQNERMSLTVFDGAFDAVAQLLASDSYARFTRTDFGKVTCHDAVARA